MQAEIVTIDKLVHGGQAMATLADGRKVFAWNALPGEEVRVEIRRGRKDYVEAVVTEVIKASANRQVPKEPDYYLATSPWQMMSYEAENIYKKEIISETFQRQKVDLAEFQFIYHDQQYHYRNKMEYSFYGDDHGLHLALHNRGSHHKQIVPGSALAMPVIDQVAGQIVDFLNKNGVRAGDLKSLILRSNQASKVAAALFVKTEEFVDCTDLRSEDLQGLVVFFSNPRSPASVVTKELQEVGHTQLQDELLGTAISYDVTSFFQVNLPIFNQSLQAIQQHSDPNRPLVDMYAGVGGIGLSLKPKDLTIVEIDPTNTKMAEQNASHQAKVVNASAEKALDYITADADLILDPPRAGLHKDVIERLLGILPAQIIYLSCNPVTQARDLELLGSKYHLEHFAGYNFFPRTPHIETLAVLKLTK